PLGKGDYILGANYVSAQSTLQSGIEGDVAGAVDDDIDVVGDSLCFLVAIAEVDVANVSPQHCNLVANEPFKGGAVTLAQWIEWRRGNDTIPEANFRFFLRTGANRYVNAADVWEAMQQHAERNFPKETSAPDQEDVSV